MAEHEQCGAIINARGEVVGLVPMDAVPSQRITVMAPTFQVAKPGGVRQRQRNLFLGSLNTLASKLRRLLKQRS